MDQNEIRNSVNDPENDSEVLLRRIDKINLRSKSIFRKISSPLSYDEIANEIEEFIDSFPDRHALWLHIIKNWKDYAFKPTDVFKECVYYGIDDSLRGVVWLRLSTNEQTAKIRQEFRQYKWLPSSDEFDIDRDINRTFPEVPMFAENGGRGQKDLFTLLKVYSLHDNSPGYCQGNSFIAGILLMQLDLEDAYVVLVHLMDNLNLKSFYAKDMTNFKCIIYQFSVLLELLEHFHKEDYDISLFCCYFLTLFSTVIPLDIVMSVMDVLLLEGIDIIFKVGLMLLQMHEEYLLKLDMEQLSMYFNGTLKRSDKMRPQKFMSNTKGFIINKKMLKRVEKEFLSKIHAERHEEDTSLRIENKTLKNVVDKLEAESSTLAEKLLTLQVKLTEKQDEIDQMRENQLVSVVKREAFLSNKLAHMSKFHSDRMENEKLKNEQYSLMIKNYEEVIENLQSTWKSHIVSCHLKRSECDVNDLIRNDSQLMELLRVASLEAEVEKQTLKKYLNKLKCRVTFLEQTFTSVNIEKQSLELRVNTILNELKEVSEKASSYAIELQDLRIERDELKLKAKVKQLEDATKITSLEQRIRDLEFEKECAKVEKEVNVKSIENQ